MSKGFLLFFILSVTLTIILPNTAYANPMTTYDSSPTAHVAHANVDNPADAYDGNTVTYARIAYDKSEYEEVKTFSTSGAPTTKGIAFVDFKMNYKSDDGGSGENYRIVYYVGTSGPIVLQDWIGDGVEYDYTSPERVWLNQREPNDGVWNWTDITDIRLRVEGGSGGGGAAYFYEYEAWVTVYAYRKATVSVNPASLTDPASPFSVTIDVATVDDLYGWEFKLYYNKTILTISTVTLGPLLNDTVGTAKTWGIIKDLTDNYNATHGRVWAAQSILGDYAGATTDSGTLATLTFTVDGAGGTATLDLVDTKLVGYESSNKRIAYMIHDTTDGTVTISAVPEFPVGLALEIALVIVIIYAWRRTKHKKPEKYFSNTSLPQKTNQVKYSLH